MAELSDRVGEVIEAGTTELTAQCYELYNSPSLGSLVKTIVSSLEMYGVVYNVTTTGLEPGRRPIARGKDESSEEEIYRSSPQLLKLLRTEFNVLIVGYQTGEKIVHYLPPNPARIHSFVYKCSSEEVKEFSQSFDFLNILVNTSLSVPCEELVAAMLRQISLVHNEPRRFLIAAGKELAMILGSDFNRLNTIIGKIRQ
jgi:hypothetical protein